ncbi:uncharacterized protein [Musca autumnalis]|uniref:uncharacterized protein n=1 Tax=Musca autumnalis TaxID=221902 RepID=UPI003CF6055E
MQHLWCANLSEKELAALKAIRVSAFICTTCESNLDKNRNNHVATSDDLQNINKKLDSFTAVHQGELGSIKKAIENMSAQMTSCLNEIKNDIARCNEKVAAVEASVKALEDENKLLKAENNALHRRLNRADFLISGLPDGLNDLVEIVISIAAFFNVNLERRDVGLACYINNRKHILVKLNCAELRDEIMRQYFKSRSLKVSDILPADGGDITRRVYLNDHFSPEASSLNAVCNKLRRQNVISKYRIVNGDKARAKITLPDVGSGFNYFFHSCIHLHMLIFYCWIVVCDT